MTEYVNQCARCGSSIHYTDCIDCDGEGVVLVFPDEDDPDDTGYECPECDGDGFIAVCMSTWEWCADHPLPGRKHVSRGTVQGVEVGGSDA